MPAEWEHAVAATDIEPDGGRRYKLEERGFVPIVRSHITKSLAQAGGGTHVFWWAVFNSQDL